MKLVAAFLILSFPLLGLSKTSQSKVSLIKLSDKGLELKILEVHLVGKSEKKKLLFGDKTICIVDGSGIQYTECNLNSGQTLRFHNGNCAQLKMLLAFGGSESDLDKTICESFFDITDNSDRYAIKIENFYKEETDIRSIIRSRNK
ncbi:hypothetical protein ACES2L_10935 [Bdellovibrio bacteriovorus]